MNTKLLKNLRNFSDDENGVWIFNNGSQIRVMVDVDNELTTVMFKGYENRIVFDGNNVIECTFMDLYSKISDSESYICG